MANIQLHILADSAFTLAIIHFMEKHNVKKSAILKKAIAALRWTLEAQTFSKEQYKKDKKPSFDTEYNHFFIITEEESNFLEHCSKVNGYFSKSDFVRDILTLYMTNADIMTEEVYLERLNSDKQIFTNQIIDLTKVCSIRLKRFEYYIRSFSKQFRDFYFQMKCLQKYIQ